MPDHPAETQRTDEVGEPVADADALDRIDLSFAGNLLLGLNRQPSLANVLEGIVTGLLKRPPVVRVRVWLIEPGDICATCNRRSECPIQTRCLHRVASGSKNTVEDEQSQAADRYVRIPLGALVAGKIAASGQQRVLNDGDADFGELEHLPWLRSDGIRGFNGIPIVFQEEVLGVIAIFSRKPVPPDARLWGRIFADFIARAIVNARAYDEIQRLKAQLEQQNGYLREEVVEARAFGDLIGASPALNHLVSQIDLVAPTEASVLVLGETGTGKELVAHEIHRRSGRSDQPLIRVNCASIPHDLFESEFFGHAKGAFTGAIRDRAGRFEAAEGGTLFLDEIGEVPLDLQGKQLRALQERRYERVGEDRTRLADVRIIAATNRDLRREVAANRFREDLFYRINVFPIHIVPLRERPDDILPLAKHFIDLSVKDLRCPRPRLTRAGSDELRAYAWPGNVRELRNVLERAVILARGGVLTFDLQPNRPAAIIEAAEPGADFVTDAELRRRERDNLLAVLGAAGWRIKGPGGAAELLGIKPTTLVARIRAMGLTRPAASGP